MRNLLIFSILVLFGCSCSRKLTSEVEVINSTFMEMVGTAYYNEPLPILPYRPIHPDTIHKAIGVLDMTIELNGEIHETEDSLTLANNWKQRRDTLLNEFNNFDWEQYKADSIEWNKLLINPKRDKRNLILLVYDSLTTNLNLTTRLTEKGFRDNIHLEDSWRQLLLKLVEPSSSSEYLELEALTNVGDYQLRPVNYEAAEQDRIVATLLFSRVVFNKDETRACYYYQEYCGRLCGGGYLVFVERTDGTWKLRATHLLWIS